MLKSEYATEQTAYICKLIYEAYRVPVCLLDNGGSVRLSLPASYEYRAPLQGSSSLLDEVAEYASSQQPTDGHSGASPLPLLYTTGFLEQFILLRLPGGQSGSAGTVIVGPALSAPITADNAADLMRDYNLAPSLQEGWLQYYRSLPVLSRIRWYHAALLLYTLVTGEELSVTDLLLAAPVQQQAEQLSDGPDLDLSYRRENEWLHHDPVLERKMFRYIANGDKEGLLASQAAFSEESFGLLSKKSRLRSKKNLAVSSITLATRAAIEGGLFWEIAYTLSDFHIQHIEELNDIPAVDRAQTAALCDFADRVRDNRKAKQSRTSALCQNYIFNHLYEEITLGRLAEIAGLNPSYLSHLFKKETGLAVSDYIQHERIEEAKRLMELPGITLSDIAIRLHFNDQSYFTKVFKKFTGMTPRQYRKDMGRMY
ncbi:MULTISPECIES: helix-turn-helix domain-containing protein [unclassified Paenibacillus]|uniref:helix-turn-helix domain-containing protein n=1 Tax=unclassified Paenibacillus TaxID=185978 RepID=UPI0024049E21|nr:MULTISPECIES: helix-turn-helix domain-containing protein [unclassified Paenibacillus]MDF9841619.1 AraC-like DNA-binding protein [Paenibacillus sp. PastF-2]MDF9848269.1 AraC-like DNA-binding protein [Paenibacillus sp. PastM-2]MDF9854778.1 AraC-like DNA-binding protein [Paenibacillus sp. PastF-1]MDH6480048.1 AraC-like DNA-binding protein [Paenibacillus sp. PastH-2]MDH6507481.1 AraC-like DNA-binding protein [Paenibacillus sp. PastM-3]